MAHLVRRIGCKASSITGNTTFAAFTIVRRPFLTTSRFHVQNCSAPVWQRSPFSTTHAGLSPADNGPSKESRSDPSVHTVNSEEIAKFAAMSEEWWAPQGPFKMLHLMNPLRVRFIRNRLEASGAIADAMAKDSSGPKTLISRKRFPLQGLSVVDIGCGGGLLAEVTCFLDLQA